MSTQDNGGPAFPVPDPMHLEPGTVTEMKRLASGMSMRDFFAAQALVPALTGARIPKEEWGNALPIVAEACYAIADAMLKARQS